MLFRSLIAIGEQYITSSLTAILVATMPLLVALLSVRFSPSDRPSGVRLVRERAKVMDIALDAGFGDISNFNRSFRAEFGAAPEAYRKARTR